MADYSEKRSYLRGQCSTSKAQISVDQKRWETIELIDISAGGFKFASRRAYDPQKPIFLCISIFNALSEFNMSFEGIVVREEETGSLHTYGIKFLNLSKYQHIQLDEIIKSKVCVQSEGNSLTDDGVYMFMFMPKCKKIRYGNYGNYGNYGK